MARVRVRAMSDLLDAPDFSVLYGKPRRLRLRDEEWDLFSVDPAHDESVDQFLDEGGVLPDDYFHPEIDYDTVRRRTGGYVPDDLDAALEYLALGGTLVKVPDQVGSEYFRVYAIGEVPDRWRGVGEYPDRL